jgi:hypothetical protein
MDISVKSFLEGLSERVQAKDGFPICYLEFQVEGGGGYNSRIAIYHIDVEDHRTEVRYKYVGSDNIPSGTMDDWSLSDTNYFVLDIVPVNDPEPRNGVFPRTWLPLIRVD